MNNLTLEFNNYSKKNTYANKKSHRNIQYMKRKTFTRLFCKNYGRFQLLLVMGKETIPHQLLSEHQKYIGKIEMMEKQIFAVQVILP